MRLALAMPVLHLLPSSGISLAWCLACESTLALFLGGIHITWPVTHDVLLLALLASSCCPLIINMDLARGLCRPLMWSA